MKNIPSVTLMALSISISIPTKAADPCQPVLCMWGLVTTDVSEMVVLGVYEQLFQSNQLQAWKVQQVEQKKEEDG